MISVEEYSQLKAFARQDGFFIGLLWVFTFGCFIASIENPELQIGFIAGLTVVPFIIHFRLRHFRDRILNGRISFRRAFAYTGHIVFYASIILAAATFIYFSFFDNGMLMGNMQKTAESAEMQQLVKQMGLSMNDVKAQIDALSQLRPIDLAFSMFSNGLFSGLLLALILSIVGKTKKAEKRKN